MRVSVSIADQISATKVGFWINSNNNNNYSKNTNNNVSAITDLILTKL